MVSFDVVSLFTRVPLTEAIEVISHRLLQDETLEERSGLPPQEICHLTNLCLRSTYFQFGELFFEQLEGAAMGSPLSPVVANLFMEHLEENTTALRPKMWIRYVDDTFVIWPHGNAELKEFHRHLNHQNTSIQFTIEEEKEEKIPFLDVLVRRQGNKLQTSVYRKPTHTDRYIQFSSHHHPRILRGVIQCLRDRALNVCDGKSKPTELKHLKRVFMANGYPKRLTEHTLRHHTTRNQPTQQDTTSESNKKLLFLPYIRGVSEKIERICFHLGVKVISKSQDTLRQSLMKVKATRPEEKQRGVVYEVPCRDCNSVYVGETGRSLEKRT